MKDKEITKPYRDCENTSFLPRHLEEGCLTSQSVHQLRLQLVKVADQLKS